MAIASSVELRHRKLVDDFIPFMSESSRRGRCRHRYATRLRSSTEFDGIVPVEYRGESQVLRFSCQRRALLTDQYTAANSEQADKLLRDGGLDAESNIRYFCCSHYSGYNWLFGGSFACASPPGASSYYFGYSRKSHPKGRLHLSPLVAMARSSLGPNLLARWLRPMLERSWLQPSYPAVPVLAPLGMAVQ